MKVLVTCSRGQLGAEVVSVFTGRHDVYGFGRDELDITDEDQVRKTVYEILPDVIIHCAAYTAGYMRHYRGFVKETTQLWDFQPYWESWFPRV
jgi:nucleoside-diphosphate-sugar epimerase